MLGAFVEDESCDPCPHLSLQNKVDTTVIINPPSKMYTGSSAVAAQW